MVDGWMADGKGGPYVVLKRCKYASHTCFHSLSRYCHFCQHVKVRASSMLACENHECSRRFCEHCLLTHLGEDVNPMSSDAWTMVDGKVPLFVTHPFTSHHLFA